MKSTPHAGIVLADSKYESETNAYLQRRMAIFHGVMLTLVATLYVVDTILIIPWDGWTTNLVLAPGRLVHLGAIVAMATILVLLLRKRCREKALIALDVLGFHVVMAACVAIYALVYEQAPDPLVTLVALFIIARAVIVPSTAKRRICVADLDDLASFSGVPASKETPGGARTPIRSGTTRTPWSLRARYSRIRGAVWVSSS